MKELPCFMQRRINETRKIEKLDNAKWILTLLMVMYHISFRGDERFRSLFLAIKNMGDCVVPAFAIISGFLFWRNVRCFSDLKKKALSRCFSLLIPYLLWNLFHTIMLQYPGYEGNISIWDNIIMWKASPHFWYLFMLMFWTVLSPILYLAYRDKRVLLLLLASQAAYMIYKGNSIYHSRFIYMLYTWAGLLGSRVPDLLDRICAWKKDRRMAVCIASWCLYFLLYGFYAGREFGMGIQVWLYGIRAVFLILGAINFPLLQFGKKTKYAYTFWMFAVHYWLDSYISQWLYGLFAFNPILGQIATWCAVVFIGLGLGILTKTWLNGLFNMMTGNRGRV